MSNTTFSQFSPLSAFPPGGASTADMVLLSTGGGMAWSVTTISAGGTGQRTAQAGIDALTTTSNVNIGGNLVLLNTGNIVGDFTTDVIQDRVTFITSVANGKTALTALPNGTVGVGSIASMLELHDNTSGLGNGSVMRVSNIQGNEMNISSTAVGSGMAHPITFTVGNVTAISIGTAGQFGVSSTYGTAGQILQSGGPSGPANWTTTLADGTLAVTQPASDNSTKVATTAFVHSVVQTSGKNSQGTKTISTSAPSGTPAHGDIWYMI